MNKNRITYFDLAKGIGIILVVLGHMENISSELRIWISSFHMPLFFIISGMLMAAKNEIGIEPKGEEKSVTELVKKKVRGILIPYFWFSLIYIPIDIINLLVLDNVDKHTFIQNILDSVTLSGVSVMWFLPALFISEVVSVLLISQCGHILSSEKTIKYINDRMKIRTEYIAIAIISLTISILSFGIWSKIRPIYENNSVNYFICTSLGFIRVVLRGLCMSIHVIIGFLVFKIITIAEERYISFKIKSGNNSEEDINKFKKDILGFSIALGIICFVLNLGWCLKNGAVDNHFLTVNNLALYYLCSLFGSMGIIFICKGLNSIGFIEFLGKNSLIIMATHLQCYLLYAGILIAINIDRFVTRAKSYVYMFNSVFFTMIFELVVIFIINQLFPFVTGRVGIKEWAGRFRKKI